MVHGHRSDFRVDDANDHRRDNRCDLHVELAHDHSLDHEHGQVHVLHTDDLECMSWDSCPRSLFGVHQHDLRVGDANDHREDNRCGFHVE